MGGHIGGILFHGPKLEQAKKAIVFTYPFSAQKTPVPHLLNKWPGPPLQKAETAATALKGL